MKLIFLLPVLFLSSFGFAQTFDIYVSDAAGMTNPPWQILKFDESGQNATVFIDENLHWPQDILFLEDNNTVLISNIGSGRINRYDATSGIFISTFAQSISDPTRMKIGPDSLLYVLQWAGNGKVRRYKLDGTDLGEFTSTGVTSSIGLDWDKKGNLYVSSYYNHTVTKFDTAGVDMGFFIDSIISGPTNIWFDDQGDLFVLNYDGGNVSRFDSLGNFQGTFITGLSKSEGVAFYPNGDILIGNGKTSSVKKFDPNGVYLYDIISSGAGNLQTPNAIVLREKKNVGFPEIAASSSIKVFPNPSSGIFRLQLKEENTEPTVQVFDLLGNQLNCSVKNGLLDLSGSPAGLYILCVKDGINMERVILRKEELW